MRASRHCYSACQVSKNTMAWHGIVSKHQHNRGKIIYFVLCVNFGFKSVAGRLETCH
jgi:hypothetical protein